MSRYAARSGGTALPVLAMLVMLVPAACTRSPDPEASVRTSFVARQAAAGDAGAVLRLTSSDEMLFDDGWYPVETQKEGVRGDAWRWMGRSSLMRLRAHSAPMKLELKGYVPMHLLGSPPTITLRWKGKRVETFLAPFGTFSKAVAISETMQAGSTFADFSIETSSVGREGADPRELGFALTEARWEAAKD